MIPTNQKMRFRDARGAAQAQGQEQEPSPSEGQEYSRTPEAPVEAQSAEPPPPEEHTDALGDAMGDHAELYGDEVLQGQAELQQRLAGYNQSASPGRGIDLNDPELLKFILLKLLESGTSGGQEAPQAPQPQPPQGAGY